MELINSFKCTVYFSAAGFLALLALLALLTCFFPPKSIQCEFEDLHVQYYHK